jgi:hypothetical protein
MTVITNFKIIQLKKRFIFFDKIIEIYLSLGLLKRRPSYRRSLHPSKRKHRTLQKMKFINFFLFLWVILPSWIRIQSGSGSTTLPVVYEVGITGLFTACLYSTYTCICMTMTSDNKYQIYDCLPGEHMCPSNNIVKDN